MKCLNIKTCDKNCKKNNCYFFQSSSNVCVSENKKRYNIKNSSSLNFKVVHIDGFAIDDETIVKCDYAICYKKDKNDCCNFVELKGSNIYHAMNQLVATHNLYRTLFSYTEGIIVCSCCPKHVFASGNYLKFKKVFDFCYIKEKSFDEEI